MASKTKKKKKKNLYLGRKIVAIILVIAMLASVFAVFFASYQ